MDLLNEAPLSIITKWKVGIVSWFEKIFVFLLRKNKNSIFFRGMFFFMF